MLSPLRSRTYRHLFAAQVIALLGTGLATVALGLIAFRIAGAEAGAVLGTALAIKMIAYVFVAPVMAALVERLPRKGVLVGADLVRAAIALSLPFIDQVWQIYVLVFILQSASATFTPAFQALIPVVLPGEKEYTKALSLSRLAYDLESLVSPLLAAALLAVMSFHNLFVGTMIGFLVSAAMVLATRLPAIPEDVCEAFSKRTRDGTEAARAEAAKRGLDWDAMTPDMQVNFLKGGTKAARKNKEDDLSDFAAWRGQAEALGWRHEGVLKSAGADTEPSSPTAKARCG